MIENGCLMFVHWIFSEYQLAPIWLSLNVSYSLHIGTMDIKKTTREVSRGHRKLQTATQTQCSLAVQYVTLRVLAAAETLANGDERGF